MLCVQEAQSGSLASHAPLSTLMGTICQPGVALEIPRMWPAPYHKRNTTKMPKGSLKLSTGCKTCELLELKKGLHGVCQVGA